MNRYVTTPLEWEENYFGITSCKITLYEDITEDDVLHIERLNQDYDFVTIQNNDNRATNNFRLRNTAAYLVDINQQFEFKNNVKRNEQVEGVVEKDSFSDSELSSILEMIDETFYISRFFKEKRLPDSKYNLYKEWFLNSLEDSNKNYFVTYDVHGEIDSLLLTSQSVSNITIELICSKGKGKGTKLLNFLKNNKLYLSKNIERILVGTQLDNIKAQNFYIKNGFVHFKNNSIYHLWSHEEGY